MEELKQESHSVQNEKKEKNTQKKIIIWISTIILIVVVAIGVTIEGIYYFHWNNDYTKSFISVVDIPIASVGGTRISLNQYNKALASLERYQALSKTLSDQTEDGAPPELSPEELKLNLLNRMIDDVMVQGILLKYDQIVTFDEVEAELKRLDDVLGEDISVESHVREVYDWSLDEFKEFALKPGLQEYKLQQLYLNDDTIGGDFKAPGQEIKKKAEGIVEELKNGADFTEKAKEFSQDTYTADAGGDLGLISRGEMVPEFEEAAFSLEKDQISDPIKTQFGYHIIKVDEIQGEGSEQKRKVRHILLFVDNTFIDWFTSEKTKTKVKIYDNGYKWNADLGKVENNQ